MSEVKFCVSMSTIPSRIKSIHKIFEEEFSETEYSKVCPIFIKKYFDYKDINMAMNDFIPKLPYNIRGLYFIPMRTDYSKILYLFPKDKLTNDSDKKKNSKENNLLGRKNNPGKNNLGKNNPGKNNLPRTKNLQKKIIFRIMKTMKPDVYDLYLIEGENLVKHGTALVQNTELSHRLLTYFENKTQMDEVRVESVLNKEFNKWVPNKLSNEPITSVYDFLS